MPRMRVPDRERLTRLAHAAQRDESGALDALLTALRPAFARFFRRHRIVRDVSEDLAQLALIRTADAVARMQPERIAQHLRTIARSLLDEECARLRRIERQAAPAELAESIEWPVDLARQMESDDFLRAVDRACVVSLPAELKAIVPAMLGDHSMAEMVADTGLGPAAVRGQLARVRMILRRELVRFRP